MKGWSVSALSQIQTYPLQYRFDTLWAPARTTTCSSSSATTSGTSKAPEIDVQEGGDIIHRPAKEVSFIFHIYLDGLEIGSKH